jgi:hypothetical protein
MIEDCDSFFGFIRFLECCRDNHSSKSPTGCQTIDPHPWQHPKLNHCVQISSFYFRSYFSLTIIVVILHFWANGNIPWFSEDIFQHFCTCSCKFPFAGLFMPTIHSTFTLLWQWLMFRRATVLACHWANTTPFDHQQAVIPLVRTLGNILCGPDDVCDAILEDGSLLQSFITLICAPQR